MEPATGPQTRRPDRPRGWGPLKGSYVAPPPSKPRRDWNRGGTRTGPSTPTHHDTHDYPWTPSVSWFPTPLPTVTPLSEPPQRLPPASYTVIRSAVIQHIPSSGAHTNTFLPPHASPTPWAPTYCPPSHSSFKILYEYP